MSDQGFPQFPRNAYEPYAVDVGPARTGRRKTLRRVLIAAAVVIILIVIAVAVVLVVRFVNKKPVTAEEFISVVESHGFAVETVDLDREAAQPELYQAICRTRRSADCMIVYYHMRDFDAARDLYNYVCAAFDESAASPGRTHLSTNFGRIRSSTLITSEEFYCASLIDDTIVTVQASKDHQDEAREILKELGY